jgi:hypothetical protein
MKKLIILMACAVVAVVFLFPMAFLSGSWRSCGFVSEPQPKEGDGILQDIGRGLAWQMFSAGMIQYDITPVTISLAGKNRMQYFSLYLGDRFLMRCEGEWRSVQILSLRKIAFDNGIFERGKTQLE